MRLQLFVIVKHLTMCILMQNHLFDVLSGRVQSRYVTDFHSKSNTSKGRAELRTLGFGPVSDSEDLVRTSCYRDE